MTSDELRKLRSTFIDIWHILGTKAPLLFDEIERIKKTTELMDITIKACSGREFTALKRAEEAEKVAAENAGVANARAAIIIDLRSENVALKKVADAASGYVSFWRLEVSETTRGRLLINAIDEMEKRV